MRLSQSELSRLSRVDRVKICRCELGDLVLSDEELQRVEVALRAEAQRLRVISDPLIATEVTEPVSSITIAHNAEPGFAA